MSEEHQEVQLYIYDMSKGMARSLSTMFLGVEIPGIWHTSIVAYGREYFFGGGGITSCLPGATMLGQPDQIENLGKTEIPFSIFQEYLFALGESSFQPTSYDLFNHNCNTFTNEVGQMLTGKGIPEHILSLPSDILNTPLGPLIRRYLTGVTVL